MDGNKVKGIKRLKSSSLIEVLVSMVIIVIVFSIAMGISTNIFRLSLSFKKLKAQASLNRLLIQLEKKPPHVTQKNFIFDEISINQVVTKYLNSDNLKVIHLTALDENKEKLGEVKKIIYEESASY